MSCVTNPYKSANDILNLFFEQKDHTKKATLDGKDSQNKISSSSLLRSTECKQHNDGLMRYNCQLCPKKR